MATSLRCWVGLHRWRKERNQEGQMYRMCRDCQKQDDPGSRIRATGGQ